MHVNIFYKTTFNLTPKSKGRISTEPKGIEKQTRKNCILPFQLRTLLFQPLVELETE